MTWFIALLAFLGLVVLALFFPVLWLGVVGLAVVGLYAFVRILRREAGAPPDDRFGIDSGDEGHHPGRG